MRELNNQRPIEVSVGVGILGLPFVVGLVWLLVVSWRDPYGLLLMCLFALPVFFALFWVLERDRGARGIVAFFAVFAIGLALFGVFAGLYVDCVRTQTVQDLLSDIPSDSVVTIDEQTLSRMEGGSRGFDWLGLGFVLWLTLGVTALYLPRSNLWFNNGGGA